MSTFQPPSCSRKLLWPTQVAVRVDGAARGVAKEGAALLDGLRTEYIDGKNGPTPASRYLGRTKALYEYVRVTLGVTMHGRENLHEWKDGPGVEDVSIGENISLIHEVSYTVLLS